MLQRGPKKAIDENADLLDGDSPGVELSVTTNYASFRIWLSGVLGTSLLPWIALPALAALVFAIARDPEIGPLKLAGLIALFPAALGSIAAIATKRRSARRDVLLVCAIAFITVICCITLRLLKPVSADMRIMSIGIDHSSYALTGRAATGTTVAISVGKHCSSGLVLARATASGGYFLALLDNDWAHPALDLSILVTLPSAPAEAKATCRPLATIPQKIERVVTGRVVPARGVATMSAFAGPS